MLKWVTSELILLKLNLLCFFKERWQKKEKEKKMIKHKCSIGERHIAPNVLQLAEVRDYEEQIFNLTTKI